MSVPSDNLKQWFFPKHFFGLLGMHGYASRLLVSYNERAAHVNLFSMQRWLDLLGQSGFCVRKKVYLFSRADYMFASLLDALNVGFFPQIRMALKLLPLPLKTLLWRATLRPVYERSRRFDGGGEFIIVAERI